MGSSVPAALAYLMDTVPGKLPDVKPKPVVSRGFAVGRSNTLVIIGGTPDGDAFNAAGGSSDLSGQEHEDVAIVSTIWVRRVGKDMEIRALTDALDILDRIRELVRQDRWLGGAIVTGREARITRWDITETRTPKEAGQGRECEIRFTLAWQHRL